MSNAERFVFEADGAQLLAVLLKTQAELKKSQAEARKMATALTRAGKSGSAEFDKLTKVIQAQNRTLGMAKGRLSELNKEFRQTSRGAATLTAGHRAAGASADAMNKNLKLQSLAVSQAAFGFQDFIQVLTQPGMGFTFAMRASANNIQQTLFLLGGMKGALIGIGVGIGVAALPALASMFGLVSKETEEATEKLKEFDAFLKKMREARREKRAPGAVALEREDAEAIAKVKQTREERVDAQRDLRIAQGREPDKGGPFTDFFREVTTFDPLSAIRKDRGPVGEITRFLFGQPELTSVNQEAENKALNALRDARFRETVARNALRRQQADRLPSLQEFATGQAQRAMTAMGGGPTVAEQLGFEPGDLAAKQQELAGQRQQLENAERLQRQRGVLTRQQQRQQREESAKLQVETLERNTAATAEELRRMRIMLESITSFPVRRPVRGSQGE